jgi:hypothetical protein
MGGGEFCNRNTKLLVVILLLQMEFVKFQLEVI